MKKVIRTAMQTTRFYCTRFLYEIGIEGMSLRQFLLTIFFGIAFSVLFLFYIWFIY